MSSVDAALLELLPIDPVVLERLCREYGIVELAVFGSFARGEGSGDSDVDLLYTVDPGVQLGWGIEALSDRLASLLGRPVDLVSKKYLHAMLRDQILSEAVVVYAA
jgi:predicted nucleotidyltransferase